jgi:hypothetical protein
MSVTVSPSKSSSHVVKMLLSSSRLHRAVGRVTPFLAPLPLPAPPLPFLLLVPLLVVLRLLPRVLPLPLLLVLLWLSLLLPSLPLLSLKKARRFGRFRPLLVLPWLLSLLRSCSRRSRRRLHHSAEQTPPFTMQMAQPHVPASLPGPALSFSASNCAVRCRSRAFCASIRRCSFR